MGNKPGQSGYSNKLLNSYTGKDGRTYTNYKDLKKANDEYKERFELNRIKETTNVLTNNIIDIIPKNHIIDLEPENIRLSRIIIDRTPEQEELYDRYLSIGMLDEAIKICYEMIQFEVFKENERLKEKGYGKDEDFYSVSSSDVIKWRKRLYETYNLMYEKYIEEGKIQLAKKLCIEILQTEVYKEKETLKRKGYNKSEVDIETISTTIAQEWKNKLSKLL